MDDGDFVCTRPTLQAMPAIATKNREPERDADYPLR